VLAQFLNRYGQVKWRAGQYVSAEWCFRVSVKLGGGSNALSNLGALLMDRHVFDEGFQCLVQAHEAEPLNVGALVNLANAYHRGGRADVALDLYRRALHIRPDSVEASVNLMRTSLEMCEWQEVAAHLQAVRARRQADGVKAWSMVTPFTSFFLNLDRHAQKEVAEHHARQFEPGKRLIPLRGRLKAGQRRLRIGYLSSDFHDHPTVHLTSALYAGHDRSQFEVYAYSIGYPDDGAHRRRIEADCDAFRHVDQLSDAQLAGLIRKDQIDILIDMKGYTGGSRPGVLALRPAPVQVNYLGYPGTMGARFMDYIVADPVLIPASHFDAYTESVLWLPDTYQPTDARQVVAERDVCRADYGLPQEAFVYCCFNNSAKIDAHTFGVWMEVLRRVEGSVLWLLDAPAQAQKNLKQHMKAQGLDPERLVFAPIEGKAMHLARIALADSALDTFICNAHTTATDALYAGVPMVTKLGETFASRVGASVVNACGLGQLIAVSDDAFVELAVRMAQDAAWRAEVQSVMARRLQAPLFDNLRYSANWDALLQRVWTAHCEGHLASAN
jgi:predicted O-linked N-acetylglucosamine transferase (SPINDLY family)